MTVYVSTQKYNRTEEHASTRKQGNEENYKNNSLYTYWTDGGVYVHMMEYDYMAFIWAVIMLLQAIWNQQTYFVICLDLAYYRIIP